MMANDTRCERDYDHDANEDGDSDMNYEDSDKNFVDENSEGNETTANYEVRCFAQTIDSKSG